MTYLSKKNLVVDFGELQKLAGMLENEGRAIPELLESTKADVDELAQSWKGTNHDRFVSYFDELYENVMQFKTYVGFYGEQLRNALAVYERLESDINARVHGGRGGLCMAVNPAASAHDVPAYGSGGAHPPVSGSGSGGAHPPVSGSGSGGAHPPVSGSGSGGAHPPVSGGGSGGAHPSAGGTVYTNNPADSVRPDVRK